MCCHSQEADENELGEMTERIKLACANHSVRVMVDFNYSCRY